MNKRRPQKPLKGYRTILVNTFLFAFFAFWWGPLSALIDPQHIAALIAAANVLLRAITSGPVGTKL